MPRGPLPLPPRLVPEGLETLPPSAARSCSASIMDSRSSAYDRSFVSLSSRRNSQRARTRFPPSARPGKIAPRADRAKIDGPGRHGGFGGLGVGEGVGLGGRRSGVGGLGREVRHGRKSEIIKFRRRASHAKAIYSQFKRGL